MTISIEFNIEDEAWAECAPWYREIALRAAEQALIAAGIAPRDIEISVLLCGDERIGALNAGFRGKAGPTNVLSWPAHPLAPPSPGARPAAPPDGGLGDIALSRETIEKEARAQHLTAERHFAHLFAHGVLHLLGYDHQTDADAALMEGLERRALAAMGIDDPYAAERE
ncbi:rRNA maturation RNase YbeY [Pikeienuella sp. HZG-20]|uniref:rRNA maturation RNase YbeY n=1 Tax=Paludibacillus litoralis TaxID=3133267 RepID=UPI0030EC43FC